MIKLRSKELFLKAISTLMEDKTFFIGIPEIKEYRKVTLKSLSLLTESGNIDLSVNNIVIVYLYEILKIGENKVFPSDAKISIWKNFYNNLSAKNDYTSEWEKVLSMLIYVEKSDLLRLKLSLIIIPGLITTNIDNIDKHSVTNELIQLNPKEENIIRYIYIASYIPFALIKFYKRFPKNKVGEIGVS